jgi:hypothetical protein
MRIQLLKEMDLRAGEIALLQRSMESHQTLKDLGLPKKRRRLHSAPAGVSAHPGRKDRHDEPRPLAVGVRTFLR